MTQSFESVRQALTAAKIPCKLKQVDYELVIELGRDYPEELVDKIYDVVPNFKGSICADQSGGQLVKQVFIAGGPKKFYMFR